MKNRCLDLEESALLGYITTRDGIVRNCFQPGQMVRPCTFARRSFRNRKFAHASSTIVAMACDKRVI